ncbi:MAG TPA: VCBS repeat-containing protein [Blastocatellia bacterium]|nr:VCBS repeat-containing protein [Blastocatellia bacterium]
MQRRRSHTVSILLGTGAQTALPGDPFRLGFIRLSRVLWVSLLVVIFGGLLEPEAAAQNVSFGAKTAFGTGSSPQSVAVGDFNGDGKLDLAVANIDDTVSILLGTSTGSFGAKTDFATGNGPLSVAVGDFNGDGNLDLAVTNYLGATVSILLGTGRGSFGAKTDFATVGVPSSVAVGDFNVDGNLDLAVANGTDHGGAILLGTGTGSFGAKTDFATDFNPFSVAVGDFNGDGNLDLAVANFGNPSGGDPGRTVSILLGTGTGSFGARTDVGSGLTPVSVAVGDFNGDGKLDLAVANIDDDTVSILLNTGPIGFSLGLDSPTLTAQQGTKLRVTVNINRIAGFTGNVTVTPPDPFEGINPKPPAPIATTDTSVTFKLKIKGGAGRGSHKKTFTARDDSGRTISATLTVIVQ